MQQGFKPKVVLNYNIKVPVEGKNIVPLKLFSEIHWAYMWYRMEKNLDKQYTSYKVFC